jgi:hypothetical protein
MPKKRIRLAADGMPTDCAVTIPWKLALHIYRTRLDGGYRDETQVVTEIVREWAAGRPPVDRDRLVADLRAEEEADRKRAEAKGRKPGKSPRRGKGGRESAGG